MIYAKYGTVTGGKNGGDSDNSHKMVRSKSSWDYTGDRTTSAPAL